MNYINILIKEITNQEFNWDIEINFIEKEFSSLNKKYYILNNLKNDFILFIEEYHFNNLIQGIINFIESNNKINKNKETTIFNTLRNIHNSIDTNKINENDIQNYITLLKSNEYYVNNGNILIKFYKALLEEKESLEFLKKIKDSIINNNNENLLFKNNEISNLIDIYIFIKKILYNEDIKSDKDFVNLYNMELENNNNIKIYLSELKYKYLAFIKKDQPKEIINKNIENENNIINISQNNNIIQNQNADSPNLNIISVKFNYNGNDILIHGNLNESMKNIINKFAIKSSIDANSVYFLYGGNIINKESLLSEIATQGDKNRNEMVIVVNSLLDYEDDEDNSIIKYKEVI